MSRRKISSPPPASIPMPSRTERKSSGISSSPKSPSMTARADSRRPFLAGHPFHLALQEGKKSPPERLDQTNRITAPRDDHLPAHVERFTDLPVDGQHDISREDPEVDRDRA